MFLSKRYVPSTPPSFVRLYLSTSGERLARETSIPIRDHVPELMYAHVPALAPRVTGTAATADAVSCVAGATTRTSWRPLLSVTGWLSLPRCVPGGTISGRKRVGRPNVFKRPTDQSRFVG